MLCIILSHTNPHFLISLVVWTDRPIARGAKSPPHIDTWRRRYKYS